MVALDVANIPATVTYLPADAGRRDVQNFRLVLFKAEMILVMQDLWSMSSQRR